MKNLGFVGIAIAALAVSGCGGGGSSPAAPAPAPNATTAPPVVVPTPGQVTVAYTTTFGVNGSAANANNIAFQAPTQTAAVTAAQANYTGSFTAASSCAQITVTPATSTTGAFTVTAADAAAAGCTVTFTGNVATATATLAATAAKPAGVVLRWYMYNYQTQSPPNALTNSPINIGLLGTPYTLAVSEQNYVGTFQALVLSAGCTAGFTAVASTPAGLATAASGQALAYFAVAAGPATVLPLVGCTITASDNYRPLSGAGNPAVSISVQVTAASGFGQ